jgi:enoyl-CoA hydratase/carnithine racemase
MADPKLTTLPPLVRDTHITYPSPHILLITLNRPKAMNSITQAHDQELSSLFTWYDTQPSLRVCIITGSGRAFCTGADLAEWASQTISGGGNRVTPPDGFCGLSRRVGKKPVIAAVNGFAYGGGAEMVMNCDLVVASKRAVFGLSEAKIGVVATAGSLPRLCRLVGRMRASEMALTGRPVSADEGREWGFVNRVVEGGSEELVREAIKMAEDVVACSPDSVIVGREGIRQGWEGCGVEEGTQVVEKEWFPRMDQGENMKEGLKAFVEKRKPRWVDSKL